MEHMGFEPTASTMRMWRAPNCANAPKNGSNGARTHDLSRVRRTLIPAELCFHAIYYSICRKKIKRRLVFFQINMKIEKASVPHSHFPRHRQQGIGVFPAVDGSLDQKLLFCVGSSHGEQDNGPAVPGEGCSSGKGQGPVPAADITLYDRRMRESTEISGSL